MHACFLLPLQDCVVLEWFVQHYCSALIQLVFFNPFVVYISILGEKKITTFILEKNIFPGFPLQLMEKSKYLQAVFLNTHMHTHKIK